jgi:hypothetical protein
MKPLPLMILALCLCRTSAFTSTAAFGPLAQPQHSQSTTAASAKQGGLRRTAPLKQSNDGETTEKEKGIYGYDVEVVKREQGMVRGRKTINYGLVQAVGLCVPGSDG